MSSEKSRVWRALHHVLFQAEIDCEGEDMLLFFVVLSQERGLTLNEGIGYEAEQENEAPQDKDQEFGMEPQAMHPSFIYQLVRGGQ